MPGKISEQLRDVFLVARVTSRIARRINSGRTAQDIDFQSGIIRDDKSWEMHRCVHRFQDRIFRKGLAGFLNGRQFQFIRQIADHKLRPENSGKFAGLMRIAGSEEKLAHEIK